MHRSILRPVSRHLARRFLVVPFGQLPSATRLNKILDLHGPASVRRLEPEPALFASAFQRSTQHRLAFLNAHSTMQESEGTAPNWAFVAARPGA